MADAPPAAPLAAPDWQRWPEAEVHRRLGARRGRLLLMFGSRACGACRYAEARLPLLARGVIDTLVYVDAADCPGLVREFDVFHLPAMFLYRDGQFHAPLDAALTPETWAAAVEAALAGLPREAP